MISEKKLEANRQNAQKSTGPRSDDGKAAVSLNSITHGLRARHAVMLIENPAEFRELCQSLYEEWQPMTPTEGHLVEHLAVAQWKMGRVEALISSSNLQSTFMHVALSDKNQYRTKRGRISLPELVHYEPELKVQAVLNGISRHQTALERSHRNALATL